MGWARTTVSLAVALGILVFGFTAPFSGQLMSRFGPRRVVLAGLVVLAASTRAMMGMFNFAGTLASGWLTDRIDPRRLLALYYALRWVSLITLPLLIQAGNAVLPVNTTLTLFAVLFGLDYIATVPPTIKLCADAFGRENVGVVYGWVFCAHMVGAALASWLGGVAYDALGSHLTAFVIAGGVAIVASFLALRIRHPAPRTTIVAQSAH